MRKLLLIAGICIIAVHLQAQTLADNKSSWKVSSFLNRETQQVSYTTSEFVIIPNDKITWTQSNESRVYVFTITSQTGEWNSADQDGQLQFKVTRGDRSGKIIFKRQNGALNISFEFSRDGINVMPFEFNVQYVDIID